MNRQQFGMIIKNLREERIDLEDKKWSMGYLAKLSDSTKKKIEKIEYGEKKKLKDDELVQLADAFQLSPMERKEFYLAALEVDDQNLTNNYPDAQDIFEMLLIPLMNEISLPSIVINHFYDIVAVNSLFASLYNLDITQELENLKLNKKIPNIMNYLCTNKSFMSVVGEMALREFLEINIMHFRTATFRYRYMERYLELLSELKKSKNFEIIWNELLYFPKTHVYNAATLGFDHKLFGELKFLTKETVFLTNKHELYLITYNKLKTIRPNEIITLQQWPDFTGLHY
jgi:hypothetical protein